MSVLAALRVVLGLETGPFQKGATKAQLETQKLVKSIERTGKQMMAVGAGITAGLTVPFTALMTSAIPAARESAEAMGQVRAALASMGPAAGRSAEQLSQQAEALMRLSTFDDDDILRNVTANMLTFGQVTGATFDRAQKVTIDLATRLKMDLQSATLMVGKALNDPVEGLTALRRSGIQFTEQQKAQITAMAEAGNAAGAQALMLAELERQFGGSAKAMRDASPDVALRQSWDSMKETLGMIALDVLPKILPPLTRLLDRFNALSPATQAVVVGVLAAGAALGPLLTGAGLLVTAMAPVIASFSAVGVGALAALGPILPIVAAVAAAGYLIYTNWDKIAPVLNDLWQTIQSTLGPALQSLISAVTDAFSSLMNGPLGSALRKAGQLLDEFGGVALRVLGNSLVISLKGAATLIAATFENIAGAIRFVVSVFDGTLVRGVSAALAKLVAEVRSWIVDRLNAVWQTVLDKVELVKKGFWGLYDAVVGHSYIPDMVDGIAANMARLDNVMVNPAKSATERTRQAFEKLGQDVDGLMRRLFPDAQMFAGFANERAALQQAIAAGGVSGYTVPQLQEALKALQSEEFKEAFKGFQLSANDNAEAAETANVRIVKSFKDMADATLSALDRVAGAIKGGGFLNILSSVVGLGLQLGSIGLFGSKVAANINKAQIPQYAKGTGYHRGGLAIVGENGPEMVNLPRGSQVWPNGRGPGPTRVEVVPSPYFNVVVDGRVMQAAPAIADAGGKIAAARMQRSRNWRLG